MRVQVSPLVFCGCSSIGRASPFQGECCGFDSRRPLCSREILQMNRPTYTQAFAVAHQPADLELILKRSLNCVILVNYKDGRKFIFRLTTLKLGTNRPCEWLVVDIMEIMLAYEASHRGSNPRKNVPKDFV